MLSRAGGQPDNGGTVPTGGIEKSVRLATGGWNLDPSVVEQTTCSSRGRLLDMFNAPLGGAIGFAY